MIVPVTLLPAEARCLRKSSDTLDKIRLISDY